MTGETSNQNVCPLSREAILQDLELGLNEEKRALVMYHNLLSEAIDLEDKKIIEHIASDEERHILLVEKIIGLVEKHYISK